MIRGIGTIVNVLAILLGGGIGILVRNVLPERLRGSLTKACGLGTLMIGLSGALKEMMSVADGSISVNGTLLLVLSLVAGAFCGELWRPEERLERLGNRLKEKMRRADDPSFSDGFVTVTLIVCVGAMAIVGSLQDGIAGDPNTLFVKALLDGVIAAVFASSMGAGVLFAAVPLGLYQGAITAFAVLIEPFLSQAMISDLSMVGSVLILAIGINLIFGKKINVGNFLPALAVPVIYHLILHLK